MATIFLGVGDDPNAPWIPRNADFFWDWRAGSAILTEAGEYRFETGQDRFAKVIGSNLTYSGDDPAGGKYTEVHIYSDEAFTTELASYTSKTAFDFATFFATMTTRGLAPALSGNDTIIGSNFDFGDTIRGYAGADILDGREGGDYYIFQANNIAPGEVIRDTGTNEVDRISFDKSTTYDFSRATLKGIEVIDLSYASVILRADQLKAGMTLESFRDGTLRIVQSHNFSAADLIFGDGYVWDADVIIVGAKGDDRLIGSPEVQTIIGGRGADVLSCGNPGTVFVFNSILDSGIGAERDLIRNFNSVFGTMDLHNIDAKSGTPQINNDFHFIGEEHFHNKAGELRFAIRDFAGTAHDRTIVAGDVNGDGKADFQIELKGLLILSDDNFLL